MWREAMKEPSHDRGNQHTGGKVDNITPASKGTSRSYTISRLKREAAGLRNPATLPFSVKPFRCQNVLVIRFSA
jgi:hypothetical protein